MKKTGVFCCVLLLLISLSGCGRIGKVEVIFGESDRFTRADFDGAVQCVKNRFKDGFRACELTQLWYDEEASDEALKINGVKPGDKNQMVLLSNFAVDKWGAEVAMEPGSTVHNWKWYLAREGENSPWKLMDYGHD